MPRPVNNIPFTLAVLVLSACTPNKSKTEQALAEQERAASAIMLMKFRHIDDLTDHLREKKIKYIIKADKTEIEPPKDKSVSWDRNHGIYYLVLLPRIKEQIYRFRIYPTKKYLYIEKDYSFNNPYQ